MAHKSETIEVVQCKLGDSYILWIGTPENPPEFINDEDIFYENPRRFDKPNQQAPIFEYVYSIQQKRWYLMLNEPEGEVTTSLRSSDESGGRRVLSRGSSGSLNIKRGDKGER